MSSTRPNLLFLMTDHQRADSLGMVQAGVEVTPNLNRLAAESCVFERAYTSCPLCVPARTALAVGKCPTKNGVVFNDWEGLRAADHKPIHQILAENGYDVAHVGVHHIRVRPALEKRVAFSRWVTEKDHPAYLAKHGIVEPTGPEMNVFRRWVKEFRDGDYVTQSYSSPYPAPWPFPTEHFKDFFFAREAVEYLERRDRIQPFALFLYLWAPHPPLRVPEPYFSLFDPARLDLPPNVGTDAAGRPALRDRGVPFQLGRDLTPDDWRRVWAAHLGLVRLADDALGMVLDAAARTGVLDNAVTLFTVDHGDHLGQRGMYQKFEVYDAAARVPLVIHAPGGPASRIRTPVSHLDVLPTLLSLLEIEAPPDLDGRSLRGAALAGREVPERPVFIQYSGNYSIGDIRRAVVLGPYKYVYDTSSDRELYDLQADPMEMTNLAQDPAHADKVNELHALCADWARTHNDWVRFH